MMDRKDTAPAADGGEVRTIRVFADRKEAGRLLGRKLFHYRGDKDVRVLALPRGGVVTGFELAAEIQAPLDVLIVRKIGVPWNPELAVAAVSETGATVINRDILKLSGLSEEFVREEALRQKEEISRRVQLFRRGAGLTSLEGRTVILVDDGVATGATIKAAIATLKRENLTRLVVALPVAPLETATKLENMVDEFICLLLPDDFGAVGEYYREFSQVSDDEVAALLLASGAGMQKG